MRRCIVLVIACACSKSEPPPPAPPAVGAPSPAPATATAVPASPVAADAAVPAVEQVVIDAGLTRLDPVAGDVDVAAQMAGSFDEPRDHQGGADLPAQIAPSWDGVPDISITLGHSGPVTPIVRAKITITRQVANDKTSLALATVAAKIRSGYAPNQIDSCYRGVSRRDARAHGSLAIDFTVLENGAVRADKVVAFDKSFESCVADSMKGWRFSVPKVNGEATEAEFEFAFALVPQPAAKPKPKPKPKQ